MFFPLFWYLFIFLSRNLLILITRDLESDRCCGYGDVGFRNTVIILIRYYLSSRGSEELLRVLCGQDGDNNAVFAFSNVLSVDGDSVLDLHAKYSLWFDETIRGSFWSDERTTACYWALPCFRKCCEKWIGNVSLLYWNMEYYQWGFSEWILIRLVSTSCGNSETFEEGIWMDRCSG